MIIDLSNASEAYGDHTTYYSGPAVVDGESFVLDGLTDRSDNWIDFVTNKLTTLWPELDYEDAFDAVYVELALGHSYEAIVKNGEIVFTEVVPMCLVVRPSVN
jgi:hypothetical protein